MPTTTVRSILPLLLIMLSLSLLASCGKGNSQTSGRVGGGTVMVEAVIVRPQPIENQVFTTGTLLANEEVELRTEISGRVTGVFFEEGKSVHKGDVLLKINDSELQAQLKRKQLEESQAADEERRRRALLDINGISREEYDKVANALNMVKAEREVIESQLAKTEIVAPFDGVVGLRHISAGSYVSPTSLVATMQDLDPIKVEFSVPEKYAGRISAGTAIKATVGESSEDYRGQVYAVEAKIDPETRTLKARATIPNPNGRLVPGSFVRVEITLEHITDAVVIPTEAVLPELNGQRVFVCENGRARSVPVTTGIRTEQSIQITQGLKANDTLIVTGLLQVSDGRPVQITSIRSE